MADAVKPFLSWFLKRQELWTHVHLVAVALRRRGDWFCIAGGLLLEPSAETPEAAGKPILVETPEICAIRLVAQIDQLHVLIGDVQKGMIPQGRIVGLDRALRVESPPGTVLAEESGSEYPRWTPEKRPGVDRSKPASLGAGTGVIYRVASSVGKFSLPILVRQLRGPHLSTWPWWRRRSSMAATAAASPSTLPQSSTGRLEVKRVLVRS
jgi:hypothetical protein